jgi:hypothetical protein
MTHEGPPLEMLLRRMIETPAEFLAEPRIGKRGDVDVAAVVWDVFRELGGEPPRANELAAFRPTGLGAKLKQNRLRLVLLGCWLLGDEWFRGRHEAAGAARHFLDETLSLLAGYLHADRLLNDPDRREEFIRRMLADLDLRPAGETESQAADRLQTLDTAERSRVLQEAAGAERRAREIREAMARAAAQDAASRYGE